MSVTIGVRQLRNDVSEVLRQVEAGDEFVVSVRGRPVARVVPIHGRPGTMPTDVFFAAVARIGRDPDLLTEIRHAVSDTTDDLGSWLG
ncbi:MAG: type II toxin-antitoxin system Phd/YefM family antitoxin [Acidimicrobiia bacterium]